MRPNHMDQINIRLQDAKDGAVFIPSDFFDIAEAVKINVYLDRLVKAGKMQRVMRGIYAKTRYSELLNKDIPPRTDDIARALARNYGWTIVPFGDTALNMLGLSSQVSAVWLYVSDGPYKTYEIGGMTIEFKHTDNKNEVTNLSYKTALVVQALKALGRENVTEEDVFGIAKLLNDTEKAQMLIESRRVTAWVFEILRRICTRRLVDSNSDEPSEDSDS